MEREKTEQTASGETPGPSCVRVPLYGRGGEIRDYTLVDATDAEEIGRFRWYLNSGGYAARQEPRPGGGQRTVLMARQILGLPTGDPREADHWSRDKLDNRRSNLRICTHAENAQNRQRRRGRSQHRGVTFDKRHKTKPWVAYAYREGKRIFLGNFADEDEAGAAALSYRQANMPFAID